jgi:hypothetical protein
VVERCGGVVVEEVREVVVVGKTKRRKRRGFRRV